MVKVLSLNHPYAVRIQKKWGQPWKNLLIESDQLLLQNGNFLLFEKGGKIFFETGLLLREDTSKIHLEAGAAEFLLWEKIRFMFQENGDKIVLDYPYAHSSFGTYQLQNCKEGKLSCRRKFHNFNPQCTPGRRVCRLKFAAAEAAWHNLTTEQKAVYNKRVVGKNMTGNNLFIKEFMKS